ncbi:MAG: 1-deoxy-D-xylulose-5-phosphate synthase [Verrucomicrobiaceae bacterium]|nr:MAG: 1-deoxy-D-xylulose-5-phosphate synthase [Verrucomicrobiaceae bacterium]
MKSDSSSFAELPEIHSPADVKRLSEKQLGLLAQKVRHDLIATLANTGGHLGPNLGVVELTIAMHRVFDSPKDKFIFDVSHQGYVHKMLTGRWNRLETMRQYEGLNGFLLRTESEHDCYGAGHAGTALSAALGFAVARDLNGTDENIVCVAGDAAFTCGPTFEALNNVSSSTKRFITVLNDNEWSIDKNVGAIARYFTALATNSAYAHLHDKAAQFIEKIGGKAMRKLAAKVEGSAKNLILPSVIFEEFGLRYYGPIDGHNLPLLVKTFEFLKTQNEPVILHIITEKGRGYEPALANPGKFHGLGTYRIDTGETDPTPTPACAQIFAESLVKFARADKKITAITAAMPGGTGLGYFKQEIPERYFDVGIAEEHAALFACGLAAQGLRPFLAIYSTFMQRAYDMIIHDMALQNLPVRLCMDRGGLSGDDGPTHHGLFDIGYLRHIPNLIHMQPKDEDEFVDMLWTMAHYEAGPTAIRYPRGAITGKPVKPEPQLLEIGTAEVVADGTDVALIGLGTMFEMAEKAKVKLEALGYSVALINPRWIKPLDTAVLERYAKRCKVLLTLEDHVLHNGFGCGVIEHLHTVGLHTPVERIGWPDQFVEHGKPNILREKHGLTVNDCVKKVLQHLQPENTAAAQSAEAAQV